MWLGLLGFVPAFGVLGETIKGGHDEVTVDGSLHHDNGALTGVLVDDIEQL